MPATSVVGLDTAKNVFQLHGADRDGKLTFKRRLRRSQLTDFFANLPPCVIGLEATEGFWLTMSRTAAPRSGRKGSLRLHECRVMA